MKPVPYQLSLTSGVKTDEFGRRYMIRPDGSSIFLTPIVDGHIIVKGGYVLGKQVHHGHK